MTFIQAQKRQAKLRATFDGPAGSGKTFSALLLAKHLGGRTALIDSEHGSASKYADRFDFKTCCPEEFSLETYIKLIADAKAEGFEILIIDSLSHTWMGKGGALETVDRLGAANRGNTFSAGWKVVTPLQNKLIDALLAYPGHVIATMRTKAEWVVEKNEQGKSVPRKIGVGPIQRDGVEYEFDVICDLGMDGTATVTKTRCPAFAGNAGLLKWEDIPQMATTLKAWLSDGVAIETPKAEAKPNGKDEKSPFEPSDRERVEIMIKEAQSRSELEGVGLLARRLPKEVQVQVGKLYKARLQELERV